MDDSSQFDRNGWVTPWPYGTVTPDELTPFIDEAGRDAFTGRQVRDPRMAERDRRRRARLGIRLIDEALADERNEFSDVMAHVLDCFAALAFGHELPDYEGRRVSP